MTIPSILHGPEWSAETTPVVLGDLLGRASELTPSNQLIWLGTDGQAVVSTYSDLMAVAESVLIGLQRSGLVPGDVVLFQLPQNSDFIAALWACFLGGFTALPVATPPSYSESSSQLENFRLACGLQPEPCVLADRRTASLLRSASISVPQSRMRIMLVDELQNHEGRPLWHKSQSSDTALLMLTSGSTAKPRLVILTHRNLISSAISNAEANDLSSSDTSLNWMPMEHIGALAFHIRDVACGSRQIHTPTQYVLEEPLRWLDLMQQYAVTVCWAPNFAYGLINQHLAKRQTGGWDLTSVRSLLNGSEAIVPRTAGQFLSQLRRYGLSSSCMVPCWGMTETAAAVTFNREFASPAEVEIENVSVKTGSPVSGVSLRVVDDGGEVVEQGVTGHLQVRGLPITPGYLNNAQDTQSSRTEDGWWRTGDLAFILDGQLTVTGREKTQLIIHGVNYSGMAIESASEEVSGVTCALAIAVRCDDDDTDSLTIFFVRDTAEVGSDNERIASIRRSVLQRTGVRARYVVPLGQAELPKTGTGKIRHNELRRQFEAGFFFDRISEPSNRIPTVLSEMDDIERLVATAYSEVLQISSISLDDNFFDLGGNSLRAAQVMARIREFAGATLSMREIFLAPTVRELADRLRTEPTGREQSTLLPLLIVDRGTPLPLSPSQQRLWLMHQLDPENPAWHVSAAVDNGDPSNSAFELHGPLNVRALQASLEMLVLRHETLRTAISSLDGVPVQHVLPASIFNIPIMDLRMLSHAERDAAVQREASRQHRAAFDLVQGPLWRTSLLHLEDQRFVFFLTLHHLICDGWSIGNLRRELSLLYAANCTGSTPALPPVIVQFADYSSWHRILSEGGHLTRQQDYWRQQLRGLTPTRLPTDHARPDAPSHSGRLCTVIIQPQTASAIGELSRHQKVTPFITLLTVFKILCVRYLNQTDITVGSPVAGRCRPELENLVGFFVNTIVLRTSLSGNPVFLELLARVRDTVFAAVAHQDYPFERIVSDLQPVRHSGSNPLFDIMFAFQNMSLDPLELQGMAVSSLNFETDAVRFDAQWDIWPQPDGSMRVNVFYRSDLFDRTTVEGWLDHFLNILASILTAPDQRLREIPLIRDAERMMILSEFSRSSSKPVAPQSVHEVFERQVEVSPDSVALVCGDREWSYAALNEWANAIALRLLHVGIAPETVVALACDQSPGMIAAMLGILKAGGAILPLDMNQPDSRVRQIWRESPPQIFLGKSKFRNRVNSFRSLNAAPECTMVWTDDDEECRIQILRQNTESLPDDTPLVDETPFSASLRMDSLRKIDGQNLACIMSTSGTTGGPKAVEIRHQGIVRLVCPSDYLQIDSDDVFLHLAPQSFDASLLEIWGPLLNGARLVIPESPLPSINEIERMLKRYRVTVLWLTAGLFHLMVQQEPAALRRLRMLLAGGDVLSPSRVQDFFQCPGRAVLVNGYGPTENTTFTCCHHLTAWSDISGSVPIGRPIAQTTVYLLDAEMNPVPVGALGELYTGGAGLARGYATRAAETAVRFVPDPFGEEPGSRLFRTGDLARWRPDGSLEFWGRRDRELKIHGYRVNPAEIEALLREHGSVREALVTTRESSRNAKQLVAYVAGPEQKELEIELRAILRSRLPESLVPRFIVPVKEIPLTPEGKLDHLALPQPRLLPVGEVSMPRTETERRLASIWCSLLHRETVDIHDSFFDLGGDSLLAMQMVSRIWDEFHVMLQLRHVFNALSVAELTLVVTQEIARQSDKQLLEKALDDLEGLRLSHEGD